MIMMMMIMILGLPDIERDTSTAAYNCRTCRSLLLFRADHGLDEEIIAGTEIIHDVRIMTRSTWRENATALRQRSEVKRSTVALRIRCGALLLPLTLTECHHAL